MKIKNLDTDVLNDKSLQKLITHLVNERSRRNNTKLLKERYCK
jgi:hypothetical protein